MSDLQHVDKGQTRSYRSPSREAAAVATREQILAAAADLFTREGFAAATVAAISKEAGVSAPTIYATFGSKGEIMKALLVRMEDDAGAAGWLSRIRAEPDPAAKLDQFASWSRALFATGRDLIAAAMHARHDPAVAEMTAQGDINRRAALSRLIQDLTEESALRPEIDPAQAVDIAWLLTGPELFLRATRGCGWSDDAYEEWLGHCLRNQLLKEDMPS